MNIFSLDMASKTGWKAMIRTPDLDGGQGREQVRCLPACSTIEDALLETVKHGLKNATKQAMGS